MLVLFSQAAAITGEYRDPPQRDGALVEGFVLEAGLLNRVEGDVQRISVAKSVVALKSNEAIENGDTIQSAASGRAEILLIPGYYLRVDHNSRISLLDLSAQNLKLKLWAGAAIIEVARNEMVPRLDTVARGKELSYAPVTLLTPSAEYIVASGGCYRFEVDLNGDSHLRVFKGFAFVNGRRIDGGNSVSIARGGLLASAAARADDEFDSWSRQRARSLVKANHSLSKAQWYKRVESNKAYLVIKDPEDSLRAKERLTVSAENGVVALVENALVAEAADSEWRKLQNGEHLKNGNRVRTAAESRAEIHVFLTCFFFLGGDTEIVYTETEGRIAIEIIKGSAIAIMEPDPDAPEPPVLTIVIDKIAHRISEKGNYRINVTQGTKSEFSVYDGTRRIPTNQRARLKRTRSLNVLENESPLSQLTGDSFDLWSYQRSRLLLIRAFARYFGPFGGMWYLAESTGEYTFVPARWEYSSPYGGSYSIRYAPDSPQNPRPAVDSVDPPFRRTRP